MIAYKITEQEYRNDLLKGGRELRAKLRCLSIFDKERMRKLNFLHSIGHAEKHALDLVTPDIDQVVKHLEALMVMGDGDWVCKGCSRLLEKSHTHCPWCGMNRNPPDENDSFDAMIALEDWLCRL